MKRLEQAAAIGNWADKRKCAEFCHLLHSEANGFMTMTLKKAKVADDDWPEHKEVFLSFFDVKGTAKLNFFSLHEMKQGPTEKVRDFWTKVQLHMDRIKDSVDVQEQIETLEKQDFQAALVDDVEKECRRAAVMMQDFYEKMIFIAGLNADIRVKVMEATPKFAYDALKVAIATETSWIRRTISRCLSRLALSKLTNQTQKKRRKKMTLKHLCSTLSTQSGYKRARRHLNDFRETTRRPTETERTKELDPK